MITVFGSINIDLVTPVERLPEPGETVLGKAFSVVPGGKGANQALAAARAGAAVRMVGSVGRDAFAETALAALADDGVDLTHVARRDGATGGAMIPVARSGENLIIVASGANLETAAAQLRGAETERATTLLLQMEVPHQANWEAVEQARPGIQRIILNVAPAGPVPAATLGAIDVLVMNEPEAAAVASGLGMPTTEPIAIARTLARRHDLVAIVTLGAAGAVAAAADDAWRLGALRVDVTDTTAAGDAFVGALAASLDSGNTLAQALHRAAVAGGLACQRLGAQPSLPRRAEIEQALPRLAPPVHLEG